MTNLGIDRKRLRQLTLPLRATEVLPLGGAVVAPSTEGAPTRAPNEQEVALVMAAETRPPKIKKVRVDLSVLEKRNICMAMDARADDKNHRAATVAKQYGNMHAAVVRRIYAEREKWFRLYREGLGSFEQIRKPRKHEIIYTKGKEVLETIRESQSVVTKSLPRFPGIPRFVSHVCRSTQP